VRLPRYVEAVSKAGTKSMPRGSKSFRMSSVMPEPIFRTRVEMRSSLKDLGIEARKEAGVRPFLASKNRKSKMRTVGLKEAKRRSTVESAREM
jgi:hypothetical protein